VDGVKHILNRLRAFALPPLQKIGLAASAARAHLALSQPQMQLEGLQQLTGYRPPRGCPP
jgi:hypothetical protein